MPLVTRIVFTICSEEFFAERFAVMSPNTLERAVLLSHLDDRLRAILKFKLREFVHLNPCFNTVVPFKDESFSIDLRNQRQLLNLEAQPLVHFMTSTPCPHKDRVIGMRRRVSRRVYI